MASHCQWHGTGISVAAADHGMPNNTIFFRQRFFHFRDKICFFARPPLIFARLYVLISDRAGAFWHLDFDEQC
jgi:hypothetical protein